VEEPEEETLEGELMDDEVPEPEPDAEPSDEELTEAFSATEDTDPAPVPAEPLFAEPPADFMAIRRRFVELGAEADIANMLPATWHRITKTGRRSVPAPGNTKDPDQYAALLADFVVHAERWYRDSGRAGK
jgi:hypothetical protein